MRIFLPNVCAVLLRLTMVLLQLAAPLSDVYAEDAAPVAAASAEARDTESDRPAPRSTAGTLTLERALELALRQNPSIKNAEERIRRQENVVVEARSFLLPKVSLIGQITHIDEHLIESFDGMVFGSDTSWDGRVELSQPLFTGGRGSAFLEQQKLTRAAAALELESVIAEIFLQVRERFYNVLLAKAQLEVREKSVRLLQRELDTETSRYQAGAVPQFNVLRAEVELANAKTPLIRAKNNVNLTYEELIRVLGVTEAGGVLPASAAQIQGELEYREVEVDFDSLLMRAYRERPEIRRAGLLVAAAEQGVKVERGRYFPELSATASYNVEKSQFSDSFREHLDGWVVGADATWNIFDSFETAARVEQARSDVSVTKTNLRQLRLDVEVEVRRAYSSLREAAELVQASNKVVEQAEESLRLARDRLAAGVGTQLDVFDAEVSLTEAGTNQVQARHDYNLALAQLLRAVGAGNAKAPETMFKP